MNNILVSVLFNSFWIIGLALLLAALSYHYDQALRNERPLRRQLATPSFLLAAWLGAALVGVGLAGTSSRTWETVIWAAFIIYSSVNAVSVWRGRPNRSLDASVPENENV